MFSFQYVGSLLFSMGAFWFLFLLLAAAQSSDLENGARRNRASKSSAREALLRTLKEARLSMIFSLSLCAIGTLTILFFENIVAFVVALS